MHIFFHKIFYSHCTICKYRFGYRNHEKNILVGKTCLALFNESMLVKSHRLSVNFPLPSAMCTEDSEVHFVPFVKNLGVTLDCNLNMTQHVLNICWSAYIQLRQTGSICHLLTAQATQTVICAFNLSCLDYCNCLLAGFPQILVDILQKVENAAAQLICMAKKNDHVQPMQSLQWLVNQGMNAV